MSLSITSEAAPIKKYGYVPITFPRDPAEVNQFSEHIVLGQILEPIVDTDKLGNVIPGIAKSWSFEEKGLAIRFNLQEGRTFSNGKKLTSKDVKYTLERIISKKSQSSNFLISVSDIQTPDDHTVVLRLKEPNVSILKALSRDQVGIVPSEWVFNKESSEPLIGSGPYRLVMEGKSWVLNKNRTYPNNEKIEIEKWQLVFFEDAQMNVPSSEIPDYVPGASESISKALLKLSGAKDLKRVNQISYAQTSAWWHPHGERFTNNDFKAKAMNYVEDIFSKGSKELSLERATGVIPKGVAGHLSEPSLKLTKSPPVSGKKEKLKLAFIAATFDEMLKSVDVKKVGFEHGFDVEILKVAPTELAGLSEKKPDVVFAGWAGGFNDPEGFIALLPTFLGKDFITYIGPKLSEVYKKAKQEGDWTVRSSQFKSLNKELHETRLMAPGWRIPFSIVGRKELISEEATFRYTPRLHAVKIVKEGAVD